MWSISKKVSICCSLQKVWIDFLAFVFPDILVKGAAIKPGFD